MTIELRRLAYADINLLRELRNAAADAFFDSRYITREDQEDWWWLHGDTPIIRFYTIWINGVTPVGFLSVRYLGVSYIGRARIEVREIGNLLLAPAYRGQGIMHAAITEVRRLYDPLTFWVAHVKAGNTASLALFARQEFVQLEPTTPKSQKKADKSWTRHAISS